MMDGTIDLQAPPLQDPLPHLYHMRGCWSCKIPAESTSVMLCAQLDVGLERSYLGLLAYQLESVALCKHQDSGRALQHTWMFHVLPELPAADRECASSCQALGAHGPYRLSVVDHPPDQQRERSPRHRPGGSEGQRLHRRASRLLEPAKSSQSTADKKHGNPKECSTGDHSGDSLSSRPTLITLRALCCLKADCKFCIQKPSLHSALGLTSRDRNSDSPRGAAAGCAAPYKQQVATSGPRRGTGRPPIGIRPYVISKLSLNAVKLIN